MNYLKLSRHIVPVNNISGIKIRFGFILLASLMLSSCQFGSKSGGYYQDDGPPSGADYQRLLATPDAVPTPLPLSKTGNKPYSALGKSYQPMLRGVPYKQIGNASWYGKKYHGRRTSSGEVYDMYQMTAAHTTLPLPSFVRVRNLDNNQSVIVKVNDRGPFLNNRIIDLSYVAALKLDVLARGTARVEVELLEPRSSSRIQLPTYQKREIQAKQPTAAYSAEPAASAKPSVNPSANTGKGTVAESQNTQGVWVQIGAFGQLDNAQNLYSRLLPSIPSLVIKQSHNHAGKLIYRVQAGPFMPLQAQQTVEQLRLLGYDSLQLK